MQTNPPYFIPIRLTGMPPRRCRLQRRRPTGAVEKPFARPFLFLRQPLIFKRRNSFKRISKTFFLYFVNGHESRHQYVPVNPRPTPYNPTLTLRPRPPPKYPHPSGPKIAIGYSKVSNRVANILVFKYLQYIFAAGRMGNRVCPHLTN